VGDVIFFDPSIRYFCKREIFCKSSMTIETFLELTATTPAPALRRAITVALVVGRPSAGDGYTRFYRRVIAELGRTTGNADPATGQTGVALSIFPTGGSRPETSEGPSTTRPWRREPEPIGARRIAGYR
jgi:hypothetical protein